MPICNRFHERLANNGKITTFTRDQVSLNLENQDLDHQNLRSMLKILYAACPCLSQLVSAQFALEVSRSPKSPKNHKNPYFRVQVIQGH